MIRGTTAPFTFKLPYPKNQIEWVTIKFWQDGNHLLPISKDFKDFAESDDSYELTVELTVADTKKFSDKKKAKAQLAAQLKPAFGGRKFASQQQLITVYPIQDDLVGGNDTTDDAPIENGWTILDGGIIDV
jgi:hypothetical protein